MCLPACPTFAQTGLERNSPRGRIALMRAVADGDLATTPAFAEEMSYCLGCLACTSACPAGVDYPTLLETARAHVEASGVAATPSRSFVRWFTMRWLFIHPRLLRFAGRLLWVYQATGLQILFRRLRFTALLPKRLRELEPSTPKIRRHFSDALIPEITPACGEKRHRVALLTGCVQDLVFSDVNHDTAEVLAENGCEVFTPRVQACCGSLHAHNGDQETARLLARRQIDAIDPETVDAIISNAGGCGSHLKHYDRLLADDPVYAGRAKAWSRKVRDISEWLVSIHFRKPTSGMATTTPLTVTYHEACHLCHGQKISSQPREILRSVPDLELRECHDATRCCGSAGIYTITQPDTAAVLQKQKTVDLSATGAVLVATANPGCHLHIENGLRSVGKSDMVVAHPVSLLARAYDAEKASNSCPNLDR